MSVASGATTPLRALSPTLDHEAWATFLDAALLPEGTWRPSEYDPDAWLFTGDPDNPMTTTTRCRVLACDSLVDSRCLCSPCRRALATSDRNEAEFVATYRPQLAARPPASLRRNQFSLATLAPTVRLELLYALQQRDAKGQKLDPSAIRRLVGVLVGQEALATSGDEELGQRVPKTGNVAAYLRLISRIVALKFEAFRGMDHARGDVWDALALDLQSPRAGRRPNRATIDFRPISQEWLREATKHWVATTRPATGEVKRAIQVATLASAVLSRRPGGGQSLGTMGFAEVSAVYVAVKAATRADGRLYDSHFRRGLWARFWGVIDLGRASGLLDELPGAFARSSSQRIVAEEANEDEIGKAIPETVIAQLDAQLDRLGTDRTYGRVWSSADTRAMFESAYVILRDTGRRPGEVVSLGLDCVEVDGDEHALVYDNHKQHRLRRRLPITAETAVAIAQWQALRSGLPLPECAQGFLFPAPNESQGPGHLSTIRLAQALRAWVDAISVLNSDLPGPDGAPLPFDRALIYPYAFRHSYAQRHADAGVGVEILKELMDHKDLSVTQGYYTVSLKRKRQAIAIMSRYVHDHTGRPRPGPGSASASRYELRSVAVPFGNCIEPSNVKAGGKGCPIRFQCAGCGFYRPDPSYLPAIEEHVNTLRADKETAVAMDADDFVVRNLADQATAFGRVADAMRDHLGTLPEDERAEVEATSAVLRKMRAGRGTDGGRRLIPLRVVETR